jgi:activator of HSP90 ATPase
LADKLFVVASTKTDFSIQKVDSDEVMAKVTKASNFDGDVTISKRKGKTSSFLLLFFRFFVNFFCQN